MHPLFKMAFDKDVHDPDHICFTGPVYAFQRRENANGKTSHVYRYCKCCRMQARSPVPRTTISPQKWQELLIESGREV